MKKIVLLSLIAIILSLMVSSCSSDPLGPGGNQGSEVSNYSYFIKPNIEQAGSRDLPALPIGTEIFIGGKITVLDTVSQQMVSLSDIEPTDMISMGVVIDSSSVISAVVRLNKNQNYGVSFLAQLPNGDYQKLNTLPSVYVITEDDTTEVVLNQLYQSRSFDGHFPHGYHKAYQYYHGFAVDNVGMVQSYGNFLIDDLREVVITWDGQSNWTSNEEGTEIIPVPDSLLMYFTEPINQDMNIKINLSNNYYYPTSMTWNADSLYFEYATMILPGTEDYIFYQNLSIYEASNQAAMKLMGVEVDNVELMNVYRFYTEDLFTYEIVNDTVYNVQTLDLRGTLGIIYP
jgi:hypothetical protein